MNEKSKSVHKKLNIAFLISLILSTVIVLIVFFVVKKINNPTPSVVLERYAILITLAAIPLSLKVFHSQMEKLKKNNPEDYLKKYQMYYLMRLGILECVYLFNLASLYITGAKNFILIIIVIIFALCLCAPKKTHLECEELEDN